MIESHTLDNNCDTFDDQSHIIRVLPSQKIREFIDRGYIIADEKIEESQIQPASIDLRLGSLAYELVSSFLPRHTSDIFSKIDELQLCVQKIDLEQPAILHANHVYLVPVQEALQLPATIEARANPRSTSGRVDLFTRLLCDYSSEFEAIPPGYTGNLFVELVPRTFDICVKKGTKVNQIRFGVREEWSPSCVSSSHGLSSCCHNKAISLESLPDFLTVSLTADHDTTGIVGYIAKTHAPTLDFDTIARYDQSDFWEPIYQNSSRSVILEPDTFYILRSREGVAIPPDFAAELIPYDPSFGEFRVHYAGFLDPGFGYNVAGSSGTPVVLEVRVRDVRFLIEHEQPIARVLYYELLETADKVYGNNIGSSYQTQKVSLGKQFK